jgi:hypothetical protein
MKEPKLIRKVGNKVDIVFSSEIRNDDLPRVVQHFVFSSRADFVKLSVPKKKSDHSTKQNLLCRNGVVTAVLSPLKVNGRFWLTCRLHLHIRMARQ